MSTERIREIVKQHEGHGDAFDSMGRPRKLLPYWGWLAGRVPTEPIEILLGLISLWWMLAIFYTVAHERAGSSASIQALTLNMPIGIWLGLLTVIALSKIIGVLFRIGWMRFVGLLGSVCLWLMIATIIFHLAPSSPGWVAYAILGLASSWAFVRRIWESSDPLIDRVREAQRQRRKIRGETDVRGNQSE